MAADGVVQGSNMPERSLIIENIMQLQRNSGSNVFGEGEVFVIRIGQNGQGNNHLRIEN